MFEKIDLVSNTESVPQFCCDHINFDIVMYFSFKSAQFCCVCSILLNSALNSAVITETLI